MTILPSLRATGLRFQTFTYMHAQRRTIIDTPLRAYVYVCVLVVKISSKVALFFPRAILFHRIGREFNFRWNTCFTVSRLFQSER